MTDDYPSFGDSSLFGANVYYRGTVALGRTGMIPAAHVYEGGLRKVGMLACRLTRQVIDLPPACPPGVRGGSAAIPTAGEFLNGRACICMPAY